MLKKLCEVGMTAWNFIYEGSLSIYELLMKVIVKMDEVIDYVNKMQSQIDSFSKTFLNLLAKKEDSSNITNNRKLSAKGDFTGTLMGRTLMSIFADIRDSLSLCKTLIDMVNHRESIGTIYDGGFFVETTPPTFIIEGGLF